MSTRAARQAYRFGDARQQVSLDPWLLGSAAALAALGLIMVGSSSLAVAEGMGLSPLYYFTRHLIFLTVGVILAASFLVIPVGFLQKLSRPMMLASFLLLALVFVPGLGHTVNGSARWIKLGISNFQAVEAVKVMMIIYMAGYLTQRSDGVRIRFLDTLKPLLIAGGLSVVLLMQPDLGSAVVLTAVIGGMVWLAGAAWRHLAVLAMGTVPLFAMAAMEPYRLRRINSFLDPWADPFNTGFQLTQALIAVGRGEIFGVGLGASIQKLFYLPEAHTDFIFAVLAEEFGLAGVILVLVLFGILVSRILVIGQRAHRHERPFAGYLAYGVGLWLSLQCLVSVGVNLGALPTKGLTLPLISSGGSSVLMTCFALGMVLRIKWELDREVQPGAGNRQAVPS